MVVGILAMLGVAPMALGADETVLVFDLENGTEVTEHSAQLLYNLHTDNITHESVSDSWNSWYEELPGDISGAVTVDIASGTLHGQLIESWTCTDCIDEEGRPTYATTLDMGWTAVFQAQLVPAGSAHNIEGNVQIAYHADVTSKEEPSMCGNEECYICANRVCEISDAMDGEAYLVGTLDGEKLSLAFEDRLEADAHQMNFDDIRYTEFIMGRFSVTMQGVVAAETESEEPEEPAAEEAPTDALETGEEPDAAVIDSPTPDDQQEDDPETAEGSEADDTVTDATDADEAAGAPTDDGFGGLLVLFGLGLAVLLLLVLLQGGGLSWFKKLWLAPKPPPKAGAEVTQFKRTPDEIGAGPAYMLQSTGDKSYIEGTRGKQVIAYESGTVVDVVGRAGGSVQVQVGNDPPIWIDEENLNYLRR